MKYCAYLIAMLFYAVRALCDVSIVHLQSPEKNSSFDVIDSYEEVFKSDSSDYSCVFNVLKYLDDSLLEAFLEDIKLLSNDLGKEAFATKVFESTIVVDWLKSGRRAEEIARYLQKKSTKRSGQRICLCRLSIH